MRCPNCSNEDTQVKDTRSTEDNSAIRRRRVCDKCLSRFTTYERIQLRDLIVVKKNSQKQIRRVCIETKSNHNKRIDA